MESSKNLEKASPEIIYGIWPVIEGLRTNREMEKILIVQGNRSAQISEILNLSKSAGIPVQIVPVEKLNRITRKNHQGIIAFVSPVTYQLIEQLIPMIFESGLTPFIIILDKVTDVRNFGAIVRTAEAAGAHAVVIPSRGSALINADAVKSSAGAISRLNICRSFNLKNTLDFLKQSGLKIVAVSEKSTRTIWQAQLSGPLALIMGSEESGISEAYLEKADEHLLIPMMGEVASLNVSVATGIVCFEVVKQRLKD